MDNALSKLYSLMRRTDGSFFLLSEALGEKNPTEDKVYEDSEWIVVKPKTSESLKNWWNENDYEYDDIEYRWKSGDFYINIDKKDGIKYIFIFGTNPDIFVTNKGDVFKPFEIGLSDGVLDFYRNIGHYLDIAFEWVGEFNEGKAPALYDGMHVFIDANGNILFDGEYWQDARPFKNGYAAVEKNDRWNFIDTYGNYVSEKWFYKVEDFEYDYDKDEYVSVVEDDNEVWYLLYTNGHLEEIEK